MSITKTIRTMQDLANEVMAAGKVPGKWYKVGKNPYRSGCACPIEYDPYGTGDVNYKVRECENPENCQCTGDF